MYPKHHNDCWASLTWLELPSPIYSLEPQRLLHVGSVLGSHRLFDSLPRNHHFMGLWCNSHIYIYIYIAPFATFEVFLTPSKTWSGTTVTFSCNFQTAHGFWRVFRNLASNWRNKTWSDQMQKQKSQNGKMAPVTDSSSLLPGRLESSLTLSRNSIAKKATTKLSKYQEKRPCITVESWNICQFCLRQADLKVAMVLAFQQYVSSILESKGHRAPSSHFPHVRPGARWFWWNFEASAQTT